MFTLNFKLKPHRHTGKQAHTQERYASIKHCLIEAQELREKGIGEMRGH